MTAGAQPVTAGAPTLPALFLGHGSPMNVIEPNPFRERWAQLGRELPRPRAVLCISAHWETRGVALTAAPRHTTVHDFYGFPRELFEIEYPAAGAPLLASEIAALLAPEDVLLDAHRGLDHGAWGVLRAMYPQADVPVLQLSLDTRRSGQWHYELARKLAPLRQQDVLILGSGNLVHNLRLHDFRGTVGADWAIAFDAKVQGLISERRHAELADYTALGPEAHLAIPTPEHYLPLLYTLAVQRTDERAEIFSAAVMGSLSMTSVLIR